MLKHSDGGNSESVDRQKLTEIISLRVNLAAVLVLSLPTNLFMFTLLTLRLIQSKGDAP